MIKKAKELQKEYLDNINYPIDFNSDDSISINSITDNNLNTTSNLLSILDSSNMDTNIITDINNNNSLDTLEILHNLTQNIVDMDWQGDFNGVLNSWDEIEQKINDDDQFNDDEDVLIDLNINPQTLQ